MLWVNVVSVLCSVETCLASERGQPKGPQIVIGLQEFPFGSCTENHLGNDSVLAAAVFLSWESFILVL